MKGVDFLRQQYANANLRIRPTPKLSPVDQLKVFAKGLGLDPERVILEGGFTEPHRAFVSPGEMEDRPDPQLRDKGRDKAGDSSGFRNLKLRLVR
jgi:hypothetical protein